MPRKDNYKPSKIQKETECYLCHAPYTVGLSHHHCLHGTGDRKKADEDGLWVWLCNKCHSALHDKGEHDKELQALAQRTYIKEQMRIGYPKDVAREIYFMRYRKYYD